MLTIEKLITGLVATAAVCGLAACASSSVTVSEVASSVNNALVHTVQCHTFTWATSFEDGPPSTTLANPVNEARLRSAIRAHLQAVGVRLLTSGADCLVGYGIGLRQVLAGRHAGDQGLIVIVDLYDARSRETLWHAHAREDDSDPGGDNTAKAIDAAVGAIFTQYPGSAGS